MKILLYVFLSLFALVAKSSNFPMFEYELEKKLNAIGVKFSQVSELSTALKNCNANNDLVLSIIKVESNFKINALNKTTHDYGLMQINKYHVDRLELDKNLLLTNVEYNVGVGCEVLRWFTERYSIKEAVGRYNVGTGVEAFGSRKAKEYVDKVFRIYKVVREVK